VSGEEIMAAFGIPPSRPVGDIKNAIREAILDGRIHNDRQEAWDLMLATGKNMGLSALPGFETPPTLQNSNHED
jgi:poly(A) polymerase